MISSEHYQLSHNIGGEPAGKLSISRTCDFGSDTKKMKIKHETSAGGSPNFQYEKLKSKTYCAQIFFIFKPCTAIIFFINFFLSFFPYLFILLPPVFQTLEIREKLYEEGDN